MFSCEGAGNEGDRWDPSDPFAELGVIGNLNNSYSTCTAFDPKDCEE